jgi:hypothetical protein
VVVRRGAEAITVDALVGRTLFEADDGFGVLEKFESRDFLVLVDALILAGQQTLPERGDHIEETVGTTTLVYEVMAPGKEPVWRYADLYRRRLRIHTKHVETIEA